MKKIAYITNLTYSSIILFHKQRTTKRIKAIHQVKKALIWIIITTLWFQSSLGGQVEWLNQAALAKIDLSCFPRCNDLVWKVSPITMHLRKTVMTQCLTLINNKGPQSFSFRGERHPSSLKLTMALWCLSASKERGWPMISKYIPKSCLSSSLWLTEMALSNFTRTRSSRWSLKKEAWLIINPGTSLRDQEPQLIIRVGNKTQTIPPCWLQIFKRPWTHPHLCSPCITVTIKMRYMVLKFPQALIKKW